MSIRVNCELSILLIVVWICLITPIKSDTNKDNPPNRIPPHSANRTRIAFGSCNKYYRSHKSNIFYDVAEKKPDVWVWLGDIAYIDNFHMHWWVKPEKDMKKVKEKLSVSKNDPAYQAMLAQVNGEFGVWDDHDYGYNNAGKSFHLKHEMRQVWLDFFNEPLESERRTRTSGIYTSFYVGGTSNKRIKIILTDGRWNRDREDILGEEQWVWIEEELRDSSVELFLIGSGTQFLPDDRFIPESWDTKSKERLYSIINRTHASVIFLSGDVHYAEIMQHPCSHKKVGYEILEITSSGLSFDLDHHESGTFHFGETFVITPTYNSFEDRFLGKNFGMIDIEWDDQDILSSRISLSVFTQSYDGISGESTPPVLSRVLSLRDLKKSNELYEKAQNSSCIVDDVKPFTRWSRNFIQSLVQVILTFDLMIVKLVLIKVTPDILLLVFWAYLGYTFYFGFFSRNKDSKIIRNINQQTSESNKDK